MTAATLAVCAVVILAALAVTPWLKREGDRNWRQHKRQMVLVRLVIDVFRLAAAISAVGPAMGRAVKEAAAMEEAMRRLNATIKGDR